MFPVPMTEHAKLAWRCRRGMRELDVLLRGFLDSRYEALEAPERQAFERLLEENDQDILLWLTGRAAPPDERLAKIVRTILASGSENR